YNLANFCRTLGLLLRSGVHLSEAIDITAHTTRNLVYKALYLHMAKAVLRGEPISRSLARNKRLFPETLTHMIAVGESTGNLPASLLYVGEGYENEVDELTKALSSSVEPILMVLMGVLVGTIAVSIIMPIYEITQHLQTK